MGRSYCSRWGRFRISGPSLEMLKDYALHGEWDRISSILGFMSEVLIVRAGDRPSGDDIEYWGVSKHFDELDEGETIPEYHIEFQQIRTCNACGGTTWGLVAAMVATEIVCQGCGAPADLSHFANHTKVRRLP